MISDKDFILTDEYTEYTRNLAKVHTEKKTRQEEMKKLYESFKVEMDGLDKKAAEFYDAWEKWKVDRSGNSEKPAKNKG